MEDYNKALHDAAVETERDREAVAELKAERKERKKEKKGKK